jgi:hypothetical protein
MGAWPCSIGGMTRRKALLQFFILLGTFVCFWLATVVMVLSGLLSVRVWSWVVLIGSVIATIVLSSLALRIPDRHPPKR